MIRFFPHRHRRSLILVARSDPYSVVERPDGTWIFVEKLPPGGVKIILFPTNWFVAGWAAQQG